eukprot:232414-Pleurochrysis_carterae.AAC.2
MSCISCISCVPLRGASSERFASLAASARSCACDDHNACVVVSASTRARECACVRVCAFASVCVRVCVRLCVRLCWRACLDARGRARVRVRVHKCGHGYMCSSFRVGA